MRKAPLWAKLGVPALLVLYAGWLLVGEPGRTDHGPPPADPTLTVACNHLPNGPLECTQGYQNTAVEAPEEGAACGNGGRWTQPYVRPFIEGEVDFNCE